MVGDDETILTSDEVRGLPLIVRKALAIRHVAAHMPIELKPDELIVGVPTMASVGFGKCFPEYALPDELEEAARWGFTPKIGIWPPSTELRNRSAKGVQWSSPRGYGKDSNIGGRPIREDRVLPFGFD